MSGNKNEYLFKPHFNYQDFEKKLENFIPSVLCKNQPYGVNVEEMSVIPFMLYLGSMEVVSAIQNRNGGEELN